MAVCAPEVEVGAVDRNCVKIVEAIHNLAEHGTQLAIFPELSLTAYTCADLFYQRSLQDAALAALSKVRRACADTGVAVLAGLPLLVRGRLYNCALLIGCDGHIAGAVPKTYLPNTQEFYEARWFSRGDTCPVDHILVDGNSVPFGTDLLFPVEGFPDCVVGIEICEDLWACNPPSGFLAAAGASLLVNPSASNEILGKCAYRRDLVRQQSARCIAAYAYASAGPGESSTDVVYSGHCLLSENGQILAETERFRFETTWALADFDFEKLSHERERNSSFSQIVPARAYRSCPLRLEARPTGELLRPIDKHPFVPADPDRRGETCWEIFSIQSTGLAKRIRHLQAGSVVLGVSGGLDSTLALLAAARAFDLLGLDRSGIMAVTMPGFGTTSRTRGNAERLASHLGLSFREIPIGAAVRQHFKDIDHHEDVHDVTYENAQARERTQVLMDLANKINTFVVGTGDLSEAALGWCTFNGDHMSMYHVNAGIPKTLVRYLIAWCADSLFDGKTRQTLLDICDTPISPELLPADPAGEISQKTESLVGPYGLHDFFLFHFVRNGFARKKILLLARHAFGAAYDETVLSTWLDTFYQRFFSQQFKRSSMPDGPKVGSVSLSPRGDWRMPSDVMR